MIFTTLPGRTGIYLPFLNFVNKLQAIFEQ